MERLGSTIIATTIISIISYQIFQLFHRVILLHEIAEFKKEKKKIISQPMSQPTIYR